MILQKPKRILSILMALVMSATALPWGWTAFAEELTQMQLTNLPTLYITLDNGAQQEEITKDGERLPGVVNFAAEGFDPIVNAPITIKGRGNSTWGLPKKPYQIKFEEKTDMLGMGKAKKWILLANYWDKTLMRNYAAYNLARRMGLAYTPETRFVDVVINGEYQGNYLLTEKVELGKERINEKEENGGVLFELEVQIRHLADGCATCVVTNDGVHAMVKEPEVDTAAEQAALNAECLQYLNGIEDKLTQGYDVYSQYIDVPSFIDWYIVNELAKNFDAAFWTSTYCYRSEDGILHMGPVWDVDVCFGNQDVTYPESIDNGLYPYNYRADKGAWYRTLFQDTVFVELLKARWNELLNEGYFRDMLDDIDQTAEYLTASQAKDLERWPDAMQVTEVRGKGTPYFTYTQEVEYFKNYIMERIDWLHTQWGPQVQYSNRLYDNILLDETSGSELYATVGDVDSSGGLRWDYQDWASPNAPLGMLMGYQSEMLPAGEYYYEVTYKAESPVYTDYFMLECYTNEFGAMKLTAQTPATHLTYATGDMGRDGYATVRLPFTIDGNQEQSCQGRISAYNAATVTIRDMKLYRAGDARQTVYDVGDVNQDSRIDAADALMALQSSVELISLSPMELELGDVNRADRVNASDALLILQHSVGLITSF